MIQFIKNVLLFSGIYILYLIIACWIDPYNIIHKENNPKLNELKSQISFNLNQELYKLQMFSRKPTEIILLGDSRTRSLKSSTFEELTGMKATNLASGAATIPDIADMFWYIVNNYTIKEVYIGINFNLFNEYNYSAKVRDAISLKESPKSYLFSKYCYKSLYYIIKSSITGEAVEIGKPEFTKEQFWKFQLDSTAAFFYRNYKYPNQYENILLEISRFCDDNNITLVFFIPPTHIDLQQRVEDFNLSSEEKEFKKFMNGFTNIYDFDYPDELTSNYNNFSDPFHYNDSIGTIIIKKLVNKN